MASTHKTIEKLFSDVRAFVRLHPGAQVVCSDDVMKRLIGWEAFTQEGATKVSEQYSIDLSDLKAELALLKPGDILRTELTTAEGRGRIAADLTRPLELRE